METRMNIASTKMVRLLYEFPFIQNFLFFCICVFYIQNETRCVVLKSNCLVLFYFVAAYITSKGYLQKQPPPGWLIDILIPFIQNVFFIIICFFYVQNETSCRVVVAFFNDIMYFVSIYLKLDIIKWYFTQNKQF